MVLRCELFLWYCTISMISFMGSNECVASVRCLAKFEVLLLLYQVSLRIYIFSHKEHMPCPLQNVIKIFSVK